MKKRIHSFDVRSKIRKLVLEICEAVIYNLLLVSFALGDEIAERFDGSAYIWHDLDIYYDKSQVIGLERYHKKVM